MYMHHFDFNKNTVAEIFESQVYFSPHSLAISDGSRSYSYIELNKKANQLAFYLRIKGVKKRDIVGILLEPSIEFIILMLSIIKVGATYLPIDFRSSDTRLARIISEAQPKLIFTNGSYRQELDPSIIPFPQDKELKCFSTQNYPLTLTGSDPIYIIYTSGSTGSPKGVVIANNAVINLVCIENLGKIHPLDRVAQFSSLHFDASTYEVWGALLNGAALIIVPQMLRLNLVEFKTFLEINNVNHLFFPTAVFHNVVSSMPEVLNPIKNLIVGGEQINKEKVRQFFQYRRSKNLPITLINGYGPTEATVFVSKFVIDDFDDFDDFDSINISIGKSIKNVRTYILDSKGNPVHPGEEGELCLSGVSLAIGYYKDHSLTRVKFIENSFCKEKPYERLYKTGDLVKELPDGNLVWLGRIDDQIKINGFRVHLREIENEIKKIHYVDDVIVLAENFNENTTLSAYIQRSYMTSISNEEVRKFLKNILPEYMIPSRYFYVDKFPLTLCLLPQLLRK